MYRLMANGGVIRLSDKAVIPQDIANTDWAAYLAWVEAGNEPEPVEVVTKVPSEVTMRQARLALHQAGLLNSVIAAIDALPEPPRTAALIEWDYSNAIQRNNVFVSQLAGMLGFSEEDLDNLFITAANL